MNCKHIRPSIPTPRLVSDSPHLPEAALALIAKADTIFLSSSNHESDMDTNIRGGPPGFVRVLSNSTDGAVLVWPEYSGNRLYQSLGNLQTTPLAGLVFPDFDSGDVLYVTGKTEILAGKQAATLLPGSNLAVKITLSAARFVENGLAFRGDLGERSPYNPRVRYLSTEKGLNVPQVSGHSGMIAKLIKKEILTPTIARFRFRISDPASAGTWKPGQYVTLSFEQELGGQGYSHMRDDDPTSLNDSYMRTFTVSSFPRRDGPDEEFEITIRNVGKVTNYLFRSSDRSGLDISMPGFGGDFRFRDEDVEGVMPFIASGIGITPLLGQLPGVDVSRVRLYWTLNVKDIALVTDTFSRYPELPKVSAIFITGTSGKISAAQQRSIEKFASLGARVERRRVQSSDLQDLGAERWYLCTGTELRRMILAWLAGKMVIYENFDY
jgi:NAD(P)H-flavin reductase